MTPDRFLTCTGRRDAGLASGTPRPRPVAIESLEPRRLLSAALGPYRDAITLSASPAAAVQATASYGVTLSLRGGQSFTGYLGVLTGAAVPAGDRLSASVDWGDGKPPTAGVVSISTSGHIDVGGTHTYPASGNYSITVSVVATPPNASGGATPKSLGVIHSRAAVAGASLTSQGREVGETSGSSFQVKIASFQSPTPLNGLSAAINWGDGGTSAGTFKLTSKAGANPAAYEVDGTHQYARPGEYSIRIVLTQPSQGVLATIASKAVVTTPITGTYATSRPVPDAATTYSFHGTGVTGTLPLTLTGSVATPGLIASGRATGALALQTSAGAVTFDLTGPTEAGEGPFPATLNYVIGNSSGGFAGTTGTGTLSIALDASRHTFVLTINPAQ